MTWAWPYRAPSVWGGQLYAPTNVPPPQLSSIDLNDQVEGDDRAFEVWHEREDSVRKYLLQARTVIIKNSWVKEISGIQQRLALPVWRECSLCCAGVGTWTSTQLPSGAAPRPRGPEPCACWAPGGLALPLVLSGWGSGGYGLPGSPGAGIELTLTQMGDTEGHDGETRCGSRLCPGCVWV